MFKNKNLPNFLSWSRIYLVPLVVLLLIFDNNFTGYLSCLIILIAGITDILDGVLARKYSTVTVIGKYLDPLADKLLVVSVLIMLVYLGRAIEYGPLFTIAVVLITSREIFITGLRAIARDKGLVIAAGQVGKIKTTFQMFAIGALVLPEDAFGTTPWIFGLGVLVVALLLSLFSAYQYLFEFYRQIEKQTIISNKEPPR